MTTMDAGSLRALADSLSRTFPGSHDAPLALARRPNVQLDERGRVVAFCGLSIRPTGHRFTVDARELYTLAGRARIASRWRE